MSGVISTAALLKLYRLAPQVVATGLLPIVAGALPRRDECYYADVTSRQASDPREARILLDLFGGFPVEERRKSRARDMVGAAMDVLYAGASPTLQ